MSKSNVLKHTTDSFEGGKLLSRSTSIFVQLELIKRYEVHQMCSMYAYKMMTSKISMYDVTKLYYQQVKHLQKWSMERFNTSQKLQDSVQLQAVLALYDKETVQNNGQPNDSRLKTSVRLHVDYTMRTRNFRVRNEIVEKGAVTNSQKGKKAYVERNVGECYQWKANGQCSKGDSCSFRHDPASGNRCEVSERKQDKHPLPHLNSKAKTDGEVPSKKFRQQRRKPFR